MRKGRVPDPRAGEHLVFRKRRIPFALFPSAMATHGRQLVADPWTYLLNFCETARNPSAVRRGRAEAFIRQSRDFYAAAQTPHTSAQPLLLYYAFMNLLKAWIVLQEDVDIANAYHGISELPENRAKERLHINSQKLKIHPLDTNKIQLFGKLMELCGMRCPSSSEEVRVIDVLSQIVGIHRTYAQVFGGQNERFYRLQRLTVWRCDDPKGIFLAFSIPRRLFADGQAMDALTAACPVFDQFEQVSGFPDGKSGSAEEEPEYVFQSTDVVECDRVRLGRLDELVKPLRPYVHAVLTRDGYRYYVARCDDCFRLTQLPALYAAFFYFGSITRYHPYDFSKIRAREYGWLIDDFLKTQPLQFAYLCASRIAEHDLHVPYCDLGG